MKKKIKILFAEAFIDKGGQEIYLINLIQKLNRSEFEIHVACPNDNALHDQLKSIKDISFCSVPMTHKFDLLTIIKMQRYIIKYKINIIHLNGGRAGLLGRIAGIFTKTKIIYTPHLLILDYAWNYNFLKTNIFVLIDKFLNRFTDALISVCNDNIKRIKLFNLIPDKQIFLIYNGIDEKLFYPEDINSSLFGELALKNKIPIIGMVGRLVHQKGIKYLLDACSKIQNVNWQLLIVGEGPLKNQLISISKDLNLNNNIIFCGARKDVSNILNLFDIFVLPSLYEAFPLSILEAMATRLPIVSSNVNGISEAIQHKSNGYLVDPKDSDKLASVIEILLINTKERERVADNARKTFLQKYTINRMIKETEKLYSEIIFK